MCYPWASGKRKRLMHSIVARCEQLMIHNLPSSDNIQTWRSMRPASLSVEEGMIHSHESYPKTVEMDPENSQIDEWQKTSSLHTANQQADLL